MKKGKLYGIGVGPGDPELITVKAVRLLKEADIIAVPDKGSGEKTALNIVKSYIENKEIIYCHTPMIMDKVELEKCHEDIANNICKLLEKGKNVSFITLGDPSIYSTYIYIHKKVIEKGFEAEMIPGVPSFCAVAAKLGQSLCEGSERLLIVPTSRDIDNSIDINANKVFMKAGSKISELRQQLIKSQNFKNVYMVENCGMKNEKVFYNIDEIEKNSSYFSIVVVK